MIIVGRLQAMTAARLSVLGRDASIQDVALSLSKPGIGLTLVCDTRGRLEGVLSKSDLITHLGAPTFAPAPAAELMTTSVITCTPGDPLRDVWQTMANRNLQNVPVVDSTTNPIGTLDIRDAMKALFEEEQMQEQMLSNYVAGLGYR